MSDVKLKLKFYYSCIPDSKDFHKRADADDLPFLYCTLADAHAEKVSERVISCQGNEEMTMTTKTQKSRILN